MTGLSEAKLKSELDRQRLRRQGHFSTKNGRADNNFATSSRNDARSAVKSWEASSTGLMLGICIPPVLGG
jgi:hypothetical protein